MKSTARWQEPRISGVRENRTMRDYQAKNRHRRDLLDRMFSAPEEPRPLDLRAVVLFAIAAWLLVYVLLTAALVLVRA
jgi:hypothetical protein